MPSSRTAPVILAAAPPHFTSRAEHVQTEGSILAWEADLVAPSGDGGDGDNDEDLAIPAAVTPTRYRCPSHPRRATPHATPRCDLCRRDFPTALAIPTSPRPHHLGHYIKGAEA